MFQQFKVDQARLAPEELKGHPVDMYGSPCLHIPAV